MELVVEPNIDLHLEVEMLVPDHGDAAMVIDQLPYLELVKVAEAIGAEPARMAEWARKVANEVVDAEIKAEMDVKIDPNALENQPTRWGQGMPVMPEPSAPNY